MERNSQTAGYRNDTSGLNMDSTKRFSDRVDDYARYRPSYPPALIDFIRQKGITKCSSVCDMGSGTGIFSRLLIEHVGSLTAVEPNKEMRRYADEALSAYPNYQSCPQPAEDTKLNDSSVDAITAAQAFHWFDRNRCKNEFRRILKPQGLIFLIWNNRISNTPFLEEYDSFLHKYGTDYSTVNHQNLTDSILEEFIDENYEKTVFDNHQDFSMEGFLGRVFSSSYTPAADHPAYGIFRKELQNLFYRHAEKGIVRFSYKTEAYSGTITK